MENICEALVSIIMPNYNGASFIDQAIESVISQTYINWELLITDDCSSDNSTEIIRKYQKNDKRIHLFIHEKRTNAAKARNTAIEHAKGKFIAFLDSDDYWDAQKLEKQIEYMKSNNYAFTCSEYRVIDKNGKVIGKFNIGKNILKYEDILRTNSIGCLTVIIDRNKVSEINMNEKALEREDMSCWLNILKNGNIVNVCHEYLAYYRRHNSSSFNKIKMAKYQWKLYRHIEKLGLMDSLRYMHSWALNGITKYTF